MKNNLARWMLFQGIALDKVTSVLDSLQTTAGQQQLHFLDQQEGTKRWEHLQAICAKINVECPKPELQLNRVFSSQVLISQPLF